MFSNNISRSLLSLFAMVLVVNSGLGQEGEDVIYLKNGSEIRGAITEIIRDSTVTITLQGGSKFVFPLTDVDKITFGVRVEPEIFPGTSYAENKKLMENVTLTTMGIKGGVNIATWYSEGILGWDEELKNRLVYGAGMFVQQRFRNSFAALRLEGMYFLKGAIESNEAPDIGETTYNVETISAVGLLLFTSSSQPSCMYVAAGAEFAAIIKKKVNFDQGEDIELEYFAENEIALVVGLGFLIENSLHLEGRYSFGLTDLNLTDEVSVYSRCIQVMLGLGF